MKSDIKVSVYCIAYNHSKYIARALNGFINQKTNFRFEVFVHDDASTDNTASIIKDYHNKYPDIIKPVLEKENQYSKNVRIINTILRPLSSGEYIAICEGDDYWCDDYKLQKQIDYMEDHPSCTLCATNGYIHFEKNDHTDDFVRYMSSNMKSSEIRTRDFDVGALANFYIPTASFVFPRSNYDKFPDAYNHYCFGGDKKLAMYSCAIGYCHYIDEKTCVYNKDVPNSATTRRKSAVEQVKIAEGYLHLYQDLNSFTDYCYSDIFEQKIVEFQKELIILDYSGQIKRPLAQTVYKSFTIMDHLRLFKHLLKKERNQ